jgi:hypothetical protein
LIDSPTICMQAIKSTNQPINKSISATNGTMLGYRTSSYVPNGKLYQNDEMSSLKLSNSILSNGNFVELIS